MGFNIERIEFLLLISAVVAMLTRKWRMPYSVGLVITGSILALLPLGITITMTKEIIFNLFLPPLIFEAALFLPWKELRKELPVVISMASIGVILAAGITAAGMHYLAHWPWISAGIFGVLISATDPVSVIATFKEAGVTGRLRILVESESLFNDGTAAVMFSALIAVAAGQSMTMSGVFATMLFSIGGGIACGWIIAYLVLFLAHKTEDHLVEITFTTIAAYGSFLLAEHFHLSGVLASLTAGLVVGQNMLNGTITHKGKESVESFWEFVAFIANSLIFLMIGVHEIQQNFSHRVMYACIAIALVTLGRAVAIYPISALFIKSPLRVSSQHQHILFWGGLRGALALALALGLPDSIPFREEIVTVAFAVVAFSILVQGMTVTPLMRWLGELRSK